MSTRVFLGVLIGWLVTALPAFAATTFKIATILPDGTPWMQEVKQATEQVEAKTAGRVKFRIYPGGVMGNDQSVLRKMKIGQLHGGALTSGGLRLLHPDAQIYSLPLLFRDHAEVDQVRRQLDPTLIQGLHDQGYVCFGLSEGGFAYLLSQEPIAGIAAMRSKKIWVPEGDVVSQTTFKQFGISPVALPLTDVLTGLQTGLLDTVINSPVGAIALQWHSRIRYLSDTPLLYLYGGLVLERKAFEQLSAPDQNITRELLGAAFARLDARNRADNMAAREALQQQGVRIITPEPSSLVDWRTGAERATDQLVSQGLFSASLVERLRGLLKVSRAQGGTH